MRVTTVGFVEFPSKFSSEISPSKATLHQKIFSNLRNGQSALELFWAKLFIKLDFPWCKIVRDFQIVFATHVAVRFKFYHFVKNATTMTSTPVETSKRNLDSPDKANPPWKKSKAVRVRSPIGRTPLKEVPPLMRSKKSVTFENAVNTSSALLLQESEMLSHMNVKDLPNDGVKFVNPSGNETVRIPRYSTKKKHWWRTLLPNNGEKRWVRFNARRN